MIPIFCGVCIFYTALGGLKAVVWTDTLQFCFTYLSLIIIFTMGVSATGGVANIWNTSLKGQRLDIEWVVGEKIK